MFRHPPMLALEALEDHLGRPGAAAERARLDDDETFPAGAVDDLTSFGLHLHYIPAEYGGRLHDYESAAALIRAVAGRDLTVAIAHGKTFLGAVCVWVAGDDRQAGRIAGDVADGRAVAWGLTERAHGSDLVGGELVGSPVPDGIRLDGEKWLINNATRGDIICVLARTDPDGGPRGFSLYIVDKRRIQAGSLEPLPKVRTIGIRGADISGFRLRGTVVDPEQDRVGPAGHGLETVLKSLQLTRTLCAGLSLGAADHALRRAVGFAEVRVLHGRLLIDLPAAGRTLAECYADHLLAEAFATVVTRSIQALPGEMSVLSAAVKYLVPVQTEDMLARLRRLLGARAWLRDVAADDPTGDGGDTGAGEFQKIERDHRIVALFDGNTVVNLNSLVSQFPALVRAHRRVAGTTEGLQAAGDLVRPLPPVDLGRLRLVAVAGVSLLHGLDEAADRVAVLADAEPDLDAVARAVRRLADRAGPLVEQMRLPVSPPEIPAEAFVLADRLARTLAGAAATVLWLDSRENVCGAGVLPWRDGSWLLAALDRAAAGVDDGPSADGATTGSGDGSGEADEPALDRAYATLLAALREQVRTGRLTSLFPARLAGAA
ncbi:acyl-CoA dehydrogenase [Pseudonocardia saturnea]|uniref:Acyl-CoA dehydrogenase n=1 Tax=Pseudonocardia saturnea TaxID=33909 RepID=A0ABQ0RUZ0_9PSEU|nr:acyl-CoA dehydrogenase [Pseudonocardia autotrophica]GEC24473.1 acyl-CoA dehydrogenase [Pseudonocardia saturnea]